MNIIRVCSIDSRKVYVANNFTLKSTICSPYILIPNSCVCVYIYNPLSHITITHFATIINTLADSPLRQHRTWIYGTEREEEREKEGGNGVRSIAALRRRFTCFGKHKYRQLHRKWVRESEESTHPTNKKFLEGFRF